MTGDEVSDDRLSRAREPMRRQRGSIADRIAAIDELHRVERLVAADRGEQYAEPIVGFPAWDTGAPLPHLIANGRSAYVVCHVPFKDEDWDGTYTTVVSASEDQSATLLVIEAVGCAETRLSGPNDEAIGGHPLYGRGLAGYGAFEVLNSDWIEQATEVNRV